jgi:hypothetical protein
MPTLQRVFTLEISPEKFVDNCTEVELQEVIMLAEKKLRRERRNSDVREDLPKNPPKTLPAVRGSSAAPKQKMANKPWTKRDIEVLRRRYPVDSNEDIAAELGRNAYSITNKASELKIKKIAKKKYGSKSPRKIEPAPQKPTKPAMQKKKIERDCDFQGDDFFGNGEQYDYI